MSLFRKQLCCVLIFAQCATLPATYVLQRSLHHGERDMLLDGTTSVLSRGFHCPLCFREQSENNNEQPSGSEICLVCKAAFTVSHIDFHSPELQLPEAVGAAIQSIITPPFCIAIHRWYGRGPPGCIS